MNRRETTGDPRTHTAGTAPASERTPPHGRARHRGPVHGVDARRTVREGFGYARCGGSGCICPAPTWGISNESTPSRPAQLAALSRGASQPSNDRSYDVKVKSHGRIPPITPRRAVQVHFALGQAGGRGAHSRPQPVQAVPRAFPLRMSRSTLAPSSGPPSGPGDQQLAGAPLLFLERPRRTVSRDHRLFPVSRGLRPLVDLQQLHSMRRPSASGSNSPRCRWRHRRAGTRCSSATPHSTRHSAAGIPGCTCNGTSRPGPRPPLCQPADVSQHGEWQVLSRLQSRPRALARRTHPRSRSTLDLDETR